MAEVKREPIIMTSEKGERLKAFDEDHTIGDVLRMLIAENGKEEVERVLSTLEDRS